MKHFRVLTPGLSSMGCLYLSVLGILLFGVGACAAQGVLALSRTIPTLHTNRAKVEKEWDRDNSRKGDWYNSKFGKVQVVFSPQRCFEGWDVPSGTVISYELYLKNPLPLRSFLTRHITFQGGMDDGTQFYVDDTDGIRAFVKAGGTTIDRLLYTAKNASAHKLRCWGFPAWNAVASGYSPYQVSQVAADETHWDANTIFATVARVRDESDIVGYIFVYCPNEHSSLCREILGKLKLMRDRVLSHGRASALAIAFGGYRHDATVEAFLIPRSYPAAQPRPTAKSVRR